MSIRRLTLPGVLVAVLAGCGGNGKPDVCSNKDGALSNAAFVFVQSPVSGERVSSGFAVSGCSSTFEVDRRAGASSPGTEHMLARGTAQGGGLQPGPFEFSVEYSVPRSRDRHASRCSAPLVTTEGFRPVTNVMPLVLGT